MVEHKRLKQESLLDLNSLHYMVVATHRLHCTQPRKSFHALMSSYIHYLALYDSISDAYTIKFVLHAKTIKKITIIHIRAVGDVCQEWLF